MGRPPVNKIGDEKAGESLLKEKTQMKRYLVHRTIECKDYYAEYLSKMLWQQVKLGCIGEPEKILWRRWHFSFILKDQEEFSG